MHTQVIYCLERVRVVGEKKPELKDVEPFKTVLSGNREAMAKLTMPDLEKILTATLTGMTVGEFSAEVKTWLATARDRPGLRPWCQVRGVQRSSTLAWCTRTETSAASRVTRGAASASARAT